MLGTTVIHSNGTEGYTESHWAQREEDRSLEDTFFFLTTTEKTVSHLVIRVQPHQVPLPAIFAFAEDSAWRCWVVVVGRGAENEGRE